MFPRVASEAATLGSLRAALWVPRAGGALGPACVSKCWLNDSWVVNISKVRDRVTSWSRPPALGVLGE